MFFEDIFNSFFARFGLKDGSPKKRGVIILSVLIGLIWGSDGLYWLLHSSDVFTFKFIQTLVDAYFGWFIAAWCAVMFSLPGYLKIRNKLLGIEDSEDDEDAPKKSTGKNKAKAKVREEASKLLDNIPVLKAVAEDRNTASNPPVDDEGLDGDLADLSD